MASGILYLNGDSCCSGYVAWTSEWSYGNTHTLRFELYGQRTDWSGSTTFWCAISQDGAWLTCPSVNISGEGLINSQTITVVTDDSGVMTTSLTFDIGFTSDGTGNSFSASGVGTGLQLDKPTRNVTITCPDGIVCNVSNYSVLVGDIISITVEVVGDQYSSATFTVTGATLKAGDEYVVTGDVHISVTGVLKTYLLTIAKQDGVSITVLDESTGEQYSNGAKLQHYTNIIILYSVTNGYEVSGLFVNGKAYSDDVSVEVTSDIVISAAVRALGLVHINTGPSFSPYQVYIFNGSEWGLYAPYIFNGITWQLCS